jgi:YebC/PmpR family DNA-binding regulatory protein
MSGHSKWKTIQRVKQTQDKKRGNLFTKLAHGITVAAREGGGDSTANFKLRLVMDQAKQANMPKDNIERAIKRGTGELAGAKIEEVIYEGYGPAGIALVIQTLTDNKNRAVSAIKHILSKYGGSMGGTGSVLWMFERRGVIRIMNYESRIKNREEFELKMIDSGAEDIKEEDKILVIFTKPEDLQKVKEGLEGENIQPDYAEIEWFAKNSVELKDEAAKNKLDKLFAELDDNPDVNDYYTNAK